jgi:hypothetical protein
VSSRESGPWQFFRNRNETGKTGRPDALLKKNQRERLTRLTGKRSSDRVSVCPQKGAVFEN